MSITWKLNCSTEIVTPNWTSNQHLKIELQYSFFLRVFFFFSLSFFFCVYFSKRVYSPSSTHTTDFCNRNYVTAVMNEDRATQYGPCRCNQNCVTAVIKKKIEPPNVGLVGTVRKYVTAVQKKDRSSHCSCGWGLLWSESAFVAWLQRGGFIF